MIKTFVIMEAAACHDGDLGKACDLVRLASDVGADAVKMQWLSSPERLVARRRAPEYLDAYRTIAFPRWWFDLLRGVCEVQGVELMCTSYLPEDVAVVEPYVRRFKVSSFESADSHFVGLHAEWPSKPLLLSAGLGGAGVEASLKLYIDLARRGDPHQSVDISLLHCVSAYPCPDDQIGLWRLQNHQFAWSNALRPVGLSDHTRHPWTGALAVAAGAKVVEFHARLQNTSLENADYEVARTPVEAAEYVQNIRKAEDMVGEWTSGPAGSEESYLKYKVATKKGGR